MTPHPTPPAGRYRTIVCDPPWRYESWPASLSQGSNRVGDGEHPMQRRKAIDYQTMTVAEITALPIRDLTDPGGCHLYLWTTNRYLTDAFEIVKAWGFRYSQLLIWAKTPMGLGPGGTFAQNAEYILFARRGTLKHLQRLDSVWFNWPRTTVHSRKPEHFTDMVEQVSPGPYVELFARRQRLGWDTWGDQAFNTANFEVPA